LQSPGNGFVGGRVWQRRFDSSAWSSTGLVVNVPELGSNVYTYTRMRLSPRLFSAGGSPTLAIEQTPPT
jgi:hypothetical protein